MKLPRLGVLALCVMVVGCKCGKTEGGSETMHPPEAPGARRLAPLPTPPTMNVAPEALPGSGEALSVVAARPQGAMTGEVRPTVTFSRPVKSLEMVEAQRSLDAAHPIARIDPPLEGEWRWLGSASVEFVPKGLVPFSTAFTVTVLKGLTALDGAHLGSDSTFAFFTPPLRLQDVRPVRGDRWVTPDATITLLFDQPVKASELEAATALTAGGKSVPLKVVKEVSIEEERRAAAEEAKKAGRPFQPMSDSDRGYRNRQVRYTLKPAQPLPLGSALTLSLDGTLHGSEGPLAMVPLAPIQWRTYGPMRIESARSCVIDAHCARGPLVLFTSNGVDLESLKSRLKVTPPVELDWDAANVSIPSGEWQMREHTPFVAIPGRFKPGTQYKVEVGPGAILKRPRIG